MEPQWFQILMVTLVIVFVLCLVAGLFVYIVVRPIVLVLAARVVRQIERATARLVETAYTSREVAAAGSALSEKIRRFAEARGINPERAETEFFRYTERLANRMDHLLTVPLIGPVGLNGLLEVIPFAGTLACATVSSMVLLRGIQFGLPQTMVSQMLANIFTQLVLGSVPLVGILTVSRYRANTRNMTLLKAWLENKREIVEGAAVRQITS